MRQKLQLAGYLIVGSALGSIGAAPVAAQHSYRGNPDFNGDGFSDLAIGVPNEALVVPLTATACRPKLNHC